MNTRTIPTLLLSTLVLAACGDDTTIASTFSYTNVSASNVTSFESMGPDTDTLQTSSGASSGDASGGTIGVSETSVTTSGDATTGDASATDSDDSTTTEDPSTTDAPTTGGPPFPESPKGCASFVEVFGRDFEDTRHVTIHAEDCSRASNLSIEMLVFGQDAPAVTDLGAPQKCAVYGGAKSVAAVDPIGVVVDIKGFPFPTFYRMTLFVDGEVSDEVNVPQVLDGKTWEDMPNAPTTPIRRATDFSWIVAQTHGFLCGLAKP